MKVPSRLTDKIHIRLGPGEHGNHPVMLKITGKCHQVVASANGGEPDEWFLGAEVTDKGCLNVRFAFTPSAGNNACCHLGPKYTV